MPVAEIFISAIVTVLFEKLASLDLLNFARREGVYNEIKKWRGMLLKINTMLTVAEDQQIKNKLAQIWLEELQDLSYDLDDVLDEFATEQIKMQLDGLISLQPSTIKGKVTAFLPSCCTSTDFLSPSGFMFDSDMKSKINEMSTRLESITRQIRDLNLDNISRTNTNKPISQRTPTTSLMHIPKVCGRDEEMNKIIEFLLLDGESGQIEISDKIGVVPIVGMGGIGKTTLAQVVYNDGSVKEHFPLRAWVCVSEEFDVMRIAKTILEAVTSKSSDLNNLDQIQVELKKSLAEKRFLIVLDDVWYIDDHDWSVLKSPFGDAARGSKVVVTTRDENVAKLMRSSKQNQHSLQPLPFNDCWSVFAQHVFENRNINENAELVEIGLKIVERCKGVPLSARVLGGLLRCKEDEAEWKDVLDSEIWRGKDNKILPSLRLSYHHLPSYLKPCFAYCSIIPKDYEFGKKELVYLWMAEGLVQQGRDRKQLEDIGCDYFHEMLSRSFFQPSHIEGNLQYFVMHDLMSDFAQEVSGDLSFRLEHKPEDYVTPINFERARHSSFMQDNYDRIQKFESFSKAKHLRTFLPLSLRALGFGSKLASNVPSVLFPQLRRLRVLSLRHYQGIELPDSIGDMKHLRYLDLSFTDIEKLPDRVQNLFNLQTLILRECRKLKDLPKDMGNLVQFRYFDVTNTSALKEIPLGIGNMKNLHMLSDFIITKDKGSRIKELGKLKHIGETLRLSGLQNVTNSFDAKEANLTEKKHLDGLQFVYDETSDVIPNEVIEREVLHMLQPHNKLKELHISWYHGTSFPSWLENPMYANMVQMEIRDCINCSVLPPLGQLNSLKKLYIKGMRGVKHVGPEFYGQIRQNSFPVLESLTFEDMAEWEDWFSFGVEDEARPFASVRQLLIHRCPKLVGKLPIDLPSLNFLAIEMCEQLVVEFDNLICPSLTLLSMNGVELQFSSSKLNEKKPHESNSLSLLSLKNVPMPKSSNEHTIFFQHLKSVANLTLVNIRRLGYLPKMLTLDPTLIKQLKLTYLPELKYLLDNNNREGMQLQYQLSVLQRLEIESCHQLVSLFLEESELQLENEAVQSFMLRLESLTITDCTKLEKLPHGLHMLKCLVELKLSGCPNLVSLPEKGFPSMLRTLHINDCKALESPLPCWNNVDNSLESLYVNKCASLTGLISSPGYCSSSSTNTRAGGLPSSLKSLTIFTCRKLEVLFSGDEEIKIHCPLLENIQIADCSKLKHLPDIRSNDSLGKLKQLILYQCKNLGDLSDGWLHAITNLTEIRIGILRNGEQTRMFSYILKEAVFLKNLTSLLLDSLTTDVHPSEWGLNRISSLRKLSMINSIRVRRVGEEVLKVYVFPLDGMLLPTSLTNLVLDGFPDLERLSSKGFESLSSLEEISVYYCPRLAYIPEGGLPNTLMQLTVMGCPLLKKQCEKGKGKYWPSIAGIPRSSIT